MALERRDVGVGKLGWIGLNVSDVPAWKEMLQSAFGVATSSLRTGADEITIAEVDDYTYRLAMYSSDQDSPRHFGWIVDSEPELDRVCDRLTAAGYDVAEAERDDTELRGALVMRWFTDPAGFRVELAVGQSKARSAAPRAAAASGVLGLGHFVLASPRLDELRHLYETVLEFRLTDYRSPSVYFFRCNSTHHSIALAAGEVSMIHHLELEHESLDAVGRAHDRAVTHGVPVSISLGRHRNDLAISFYVRNPSGFHVEIGCGGIEIGADWIPYDFGASDVWGHHHAAENPFAQS